MKREDVIRMALEAGIVVTGDAVWKLCELVAAAEREACREIAAQYASCEGIAQRIEQEIRERGEK